MKTGCASHWATHEFEQEARINRLCFLNWLDFKDEFQKNFMPLDLEAAAINILETTTYFQGKWMVDDYLDQFWDLIYDSGYTNPKTVMVKFRRGLDSPRGNDIRKAFRYGPGSLVPSCSPDGSKLCSRQGFPCFSPTTLHPNSCSKPPSSGKSPWL